MSGESKQYVEGEERLEEAKDVSDRNDVVGVDAAAVAALIEETTGENPLHIPNLADSVPCEVDLSEQLKQIAAGLENGGAVSHGVLDAVHGVQEPAASPGSVQEYVSALVGRIEASLGRVEVGLDGLESVQAGQRAALTKLAGTFGSLQGSHDRLAGQFTSLEGDLPEVPFQR